MMNATRFLPGLTLKIHLCHRQVPSITALIIWMILTLIS